MKKFALLFFAVTAVYLGKSQTTNDEKLAAMELVQSNKELLNIPYKDLSEAIITSTYKNKFAGTTMVYLQQGYKGIPVYNQIITLAFKNGKLVSKAGEFIANIEKIANVKNGAPMVSAQDAVLEAIKNKKLKPTGNPTVVSKKENKIEFGTLGISRENITAELMWFPNESGKINVNLGWQVYIIQNTSSDYWLINVDAINKNILSVHNLTVYCNWDDPAKSCDNIEHKNLDHNTNKNLNLTQFSKESSLQINNKLNSPTAVNNATYRVIRYPAESPIHAGGNPALVSNPWNLSGAGNNATTLNWHSIGTTNYDFTRGNNVWAQEDRNANNGTAPVQVLSSTTPDPLTFDFVPDLTVDPTQTTPVPNQQFNTVNLFYWNNIVHDLTYQYGFDEPARNFQGDNMGRGGNQNDFVFADSQDGAGTNNANFSTPPDGSSGRMQMYLWTGATPNKDGDVDNGIIAHEYAHGISNRLTGNGSSCLQNAEQMGEGWSDYYALMYTQDWATATLNTGFNTPRGIGTYVVNQPATGLGIRSQRYSTNFAVNNKVYATSIPSQVHSRGEIWCAVLWDMTWGIINQVGSINPNLFNASAAGGNNIALKLVTEGLKLQPCSPGFISSRDAILQADLNLYGGAYRCTILESFRRRGMGLGASQGSSASVTDQIPSFTNGGAAIVLLQSTPISVQEGQNIVYINRVTTDPCSGFTGHTITDTLPLNVTYVSGGTYNSSNRVVSFPVTQGAGTTVDYSFTVNINAGTYFAPVTILTEPVPATMPATWTPVTTVPTGGTLWTVSTLQANSAPNAFFVNNDVISTDKRLELTNGIVLPTGASAYSKLSFWHKFNTEDGWDGGVAEISTNGGTTWTDLGINMLTNPYNNTLGAGTGNNLSNRAAFSGLIPAFIKTTANLSSYAGQTAKIRFRFASDDNTAGTGTPTGWFVDDIDIINSATVSMRSSFFNAGMVRTNFADTVTLILQGATGPSIILTSAPSTGNQSICSNTAIANIVYTTSGGVTGATVTGLPAGITGTYASGVFTISGTAAGLGTFNYTVTTTGAATVASVSGIITVSPNTTLALSSAAGTTNQTVNLTTPITSITYTTGNGVTGASVTGLPAGVAGAFSGGTNGNITISGSPTVAGTFTYTVTTSGGCGVQTSTGTITVVIAPALTLTSAAGTNNQSVCINTAINNIVYSSAGGVTGATATGLPTGVTGNYASGVFTISGTPTVTGTFSYTVTSSGVTPNAVATGIITVNGATTLALTSTAATTSQTVTVNSTITNITYSTSGGVTGAIVTGLPAGVTGTYSGGTNGTFTISGTPTATGTFNYTITTSGGCGTQSRTGSITVVMPPSITLTSAAGTNAQTICIGNAIATITYTTSGGITGATTTGLPAGVTGSYSGGTNGTYTISGTATTTGTINYTITTSGGVTTATGSITINALPATPAATTLVAYCQGSTAIPLTATGSTVLWYIAATGGVGSTIAPTPLTTTIGSITYYVSQTINGCEGPRLAIIVTVNVIPSAPLATTPLTYCQSATAVALTATGTNLKWYTAATGGTGISVAPIPSTANAGAIIYYVSQTMGICEGPRTAITVNVTALPTAPTVVSPVVYCQGATATVLVATGTGLLWYTTATGGAVGVSTAPIPSTLVAGTITYYVAQTNSCGEGARAAIVVTTTSTPVAVTNLNATNITKTSALLNWIGAAGSFYTIEYKISTASTWTVVASGITANSIAVNNLIRGTTYNWRVYSNCSTSGGGNVSSVATFTTISRNNAITNLKNGFGLKLTPNPIQSSGILDYLVPANGTIGITVIDVNGKIIRSLFNANQNAGQYELNITNQLNTLAKGTYIIKLSQNGNGISLKFIKD